MGWLCLDFKFDSRVKGCLLGLDHKTSTKFCLFFWTVCLPWYWNRPAELMLMGFVSLLLAVFQGPVQKKCIKEDVAKHWLPCDGGGHEDNSTSNIATAHFSVFSKTGRHLLAEAAGDSSCPAVGASEFSNQLFHAVFCLLYLYSSPNCKTM